MPASRAPRLCAHCGSAVPSTLDGAYCCAGCAAVAQLLSAEGLERYYALTSGPRPPANPARPDGHAWLAPLVEEAKAAARDGRQRLELDVQGIACAACVWLHEELFRRHGGLQLTVNPALGTARLVYGDGFDAEGFVGHVESFGYRFGPARKETARPRDGLTWRLGVTAALTMNVMLFSIAFHFGLSKSDPQIFRLFSALSLALASAAVAVGGWPFFAAAFRALRAGVLHLDLPIALGIAMVWAVSLAQARAGRGDLAYLDTLSTFITLMLFGRWLQRRLVERNRRFLLDDDGADGLWVRRLEGGQPRAVRAPQVRASNLLLIARGDVVPVDGVALGAATVSTEWIDGEPAAHGVEAGRPLKAGSVNAGAAAFTLRAAQAFSDSQLLPLLRAAAPGRRDAPHQRFWDLVSRRWVVGVLGASALGFAIWFHAGVPRAIDVAAGLLVVTCPCAIGLAVPLAYELTQQALRRQGFYARKLDVLDRLLRVKQVIFDKTGTLTLGTLSLERPEVLAGLEPSARDAAFSLAARSSHPVSSCLAAALDQAGARFDASMAVTEVAGQGVEGRDASGALFRLGREAWALGAAAGEPSGRTVLARDGRRVADLSVREVMRRDAAEELASLQRGGRSVWLMSGDTPARVRQVAERLGVPAERALGGLSPEGKAEKVAALDRHDTLYLGDGVNDAPAFGAAYLAGTPAIERPVLPARSDFFLLGGGLSSLSFALEQAARLRQVVRTLLFTSLAYNGVAIGFGLLGALTPVRAAVAMPLSTISLLLFTVARLGRRAPVVPALRLSEVKP